MTIKYVHLRCFQLEGTIEPKGGITIAYEFMLDNGPTSVVRYSFAICSPKDHYNKKIGRAVAAGRLRPGSKAPTYEFHRVEGVNTVEQILNYHEVLLAEAQEEV